MAGKSHPFKSLLVLILFVLWALSFSGSSTVQAEKPSGSLTLVFEAAPEPHEGEVIDVTLTVTSRRDSPELSITLEVPAHLPLIDGTLMWTGSVRNGDPVRIQIRVGPLEGRSEIVARAGVNLSSSLDQEEEITWTQAVSIVLDPDPQTMPSSRVRHGRRGEAVLEIPVHQK